MTPEQIRETVQRALDAMFCPCYDPATMEYGDDYPCPKCALAEYAAELERQAVA